MRLFASVAATLLTLAFVSVGFAQTSSTALIPNLIRYEGTLHDARAAASPSTNVTVGVTFAIYKQQEGGAPLWMETQNVTPDPHGNYSVLLGSTTATGLPGDLFSAQEQRWLGIQVQSEAEQPRVLLVSVPYAFKAHEAETLGGQPASAFALAPQSGVSGVSSETSSPSNAPAGGGPSGPKPLISGHGAAGYLAYWKNAVLLGDSNIYQNANGNLGVGTQNPIYPVEVFSNNGAAALQVAQGANAGAAVEGDALGANGGNVGVLGTSLGETGIGVQGVSKSGQGAGIGVEGGSGSTMGIGVYGSDSANSGDTTGVLGVVISPAGSGVFGENQATSGMAIGVSGLTYSDAGYGVFGEAMGATGLNFGVVGQSVSTTGSGILGLGKGTSGDNTGVLGIAVSPAGSGVFGENQATTGAAIGVSALTYSDAGIGMLGVGVAQSAESQKVTLRPIGVWGDTNVDTGVGVLATADFGIAFAGYNDAENISTAKFQNDESIDETGNVLATKGGHFGGICEIDVSGDLGCTGNIGGAAPVDGGMRKVALYAVEAPENWFEDIGSAQLSNGSTVVPLESTFAQTVNSEMEYHVFLTPKGDCKGLYVTNETANSFEVRELGGGKANIAFDYRIVARRKGYENVRLADKTKQFARVANEPAPGKVATPRLPRVIVSGKK